jgi:hypothetical protein
MDGSAGNGMAGFGCVGMTGSHSAKRYLGNEEPSIEELLTDPIAVLLRRSDGLSLEDVCRYVADAMARKRYRGGGSEPFCGSGIPRSFDKLS